MTTRVIELARNGNTVITKKYGMTREEFERDHLRAFVPVVIGDATAAWPARRTFTPELFRGRFGDREVTVGEQKYKLRALLDLLAESSPERPAPYPCNFDLDVLFPELVADVEPRYTYALPDRTNHRLLPRRFLGGAATFEIFFGGPGGKFPYMHYDYMGFHAFINELVGRKEFTAIPPHQTECVYPDPANPWKSRIENHHAPDLGKYPLYAKAEPVTFTIEPGETLFIPNGWWHTARSLELTISVAFDMLEHTNWERFRAEVWTMMKNARSAKRLAADVYLRTLGVVLSLEERVRARA
ncbi:MAG: cupin-like domain-containing protein [Polyangiales bacterium]